MIQKILIGTGLAFVVSSLYGFKKYDEYKHALDQLEVKPYDIADFGKTTWQKLAFSIKLKINNPTTTSLTIDTLGTITVKKVTILDDLNNLITKIDVNKSSINIPAMGYSITGWLPVEIPLDNAINQIVGTINNYLSGMEPTAQFYNYKYIVTLNIKGIGDYEIS